MLVAPYVGAWIEIYLIAQVLEQKKKSPLT